jgi:hypothetical protein
MKLQAVTLQVAGSNPAEASILWPRSSADRAGRFSTPRRHGRMTWRMQRKLHRPRRVRIPQGKSRSHSGSGCFLEIGRHVRQRRKAGNDIGAPRMELQVRSLLRRRLPSWRTGGTFRVDRLSARLAAANAGRNYRHPRWMVWQVRLLLGIRSLARAGPSGFVHPRRRCNALHYPSTVGTDDPGKCRQDYR